MFDAPGCRTGAAEFRTCYCGLSLAVAIAESVLHDELPVDGVFHISRTALEQRYLHRFNGRALRLLELTGATLKRMAGHADLAGTASYAITQQWSLAVFQNPLRFDGFVYMSRHLNTGRLKHKERRKLPSAPEFHVRVCIGRFHQTAIPP